MKSLQVKFLLVVSKKTELKNILHPWSFSEAYNEKRWHTSIEQLQHAVQHLDLVEAEFPLSKYPL